LPHPRLHERRFVLSPMAELAPTLMHPKLNASISEMLAAIKSPHRVTLARADSAASSAEAPRISSITLFGRFINRAYNPSR